MSERKKVVEVLVKARQILSKEENWTRGNYARDADGEPVYFDSSKAVCFCSIGAVAASALPKLPGQYVVALEALEMVVEPMPIIAFNDAESTSHKDVMAMFDLAIESLESGQ